MCDLFVFKKSWIIVGGIGAIAVEQLLLSFIYFTPFTDKYLLVFERWHLQVFFLLLKSTG